MLTLDRLIACGIAAPQARVFLGPLALAFQKFHLDTPARQAGFIAQAGHESAKFCRLEENLNYTKPERICAVFPSSVKSVKDAVSLTNNPEALANRVYADRLGNGGENSGDGWAYRGRGLFQLTGRANYMVAGDALGVDLKGHPDRVAEPEMAAMTSGWFWAAAGLNDLADGQQTDTITRKINGRAMLGAAERRAAFAVALQALS